MNELLKTIFCANEQEETAHVLSAAQNGDIVATCKICDRVLKFPAGLTPEDFAKLLVAHKEANIGQVTQASIEKTLSLLADKLVEKPVK